MRTATKLTKTGWCLNGQHEGMKPKSPSGKPMPTCTNWTWCKCNCHVEITKMFEMIDEPRPDAEQNPEYKPDRSEFVMPSRIDVMVDNGLLMPDGTSAPINTERPVTDQQDGTTGTLASPATMAQQSTRIFGPTPTGRKAKGQLEYDVLEVCNAYVSGVYDWSACTPLNVAEQIGKKYASEPCSTGAVCSVWDRWDKIEFAVQDSKPRRFVKFTGDSSAHALEMLKVSIKQAKRRGEAEARRAIRPRKQR